MSGRSALLACLALALASLPVAAGAAAGCNIAKFTEFPTTMVGRRAQVSVKIEGVETPFVVDSGSFYSMMNPETVKRFKLESRPAPFGYYITGVGGSESRVDVATVRAFGLGGFNIPNVPFLVIPGIGDGTAGLLGQNVMSAFDTEYDLGNGVIRLMKPSAGCERAVLAYWAQGMAVGVVDIDKISPQDPHIRGEAMLNGQKIKVEFDTGAPASILKRSAAERAGFRVDGPGVQAAGVSGGIGSRLTESWVAPFELLDIGGEQIKNTRLRVSGISLERADMLLGADFFLSHRIYVSKQQHRIYFTYNGGPVFRLDRAGVAAAAPSAPPAAGGGPGPSPGAPAAPGPYADAPTDAAGFVRRGEASMSRRDFAGAIADFSRAAELEPTAPQHFRERARAHLLKGEPLLAMADFDQALKLKPDDAASLIGRGELFLVSRDAVRAKADFDAALRLEPDRGLQVAGIYTAVGRFEEAIGQYDAWIAAHPAAPALTDAFNGRCWARTLWNHELDKALADCEAALKRGPKTAALLDSRGLAHLRRKELDAAIADYDQALRLQPRLAWAMLGRGLAKRAKGDEAGAEADIAAAAALAPGLPAVARRYGLMEPAAKPAAS